MTNNHDECVPMQFCDERHASSQRDITSRLAGIQSSLTEISAQVRTTNGRVGALERWKAYVFGAAASIAVFVPLLTAVIMKVLFG